MEISYKSLDFFSSLSVFWSWYLCYRTAGNVSCLNKHLLKNNSCRVSFHPKCYSLFKFKQLVKIHCYNCTLWWPQKGLNGTCDLPIIIYGQWKWYLPTLIWPLGKGTKTNFNWNTEIWTKFCPWKWDLYLSHHFRCLPSQVQDCSRPLETRGHRDLR